MHRATESSFPISIAIPLTNPIPSRSRLQSLESQRIHLAERPIIPLNSHYCMETDSRHISPGRAVREDLHPWMDANKPCTMSGEHTDARTDLLCATN